MSKLKSNKTMIENVVNELFGPTEIEWRNGKHPVATFYIKGDKFTYSVDGTNKGSYTPEKTKKMMINSLVRKSMSHGYIDDPSEFMRKYGK